MGKRGTKEPDFLPFWTNVRQLLLSEYGQDGARNRETMRRRAALASDLGLEDVTVRAFLNGSQKTLGESPRKKLCARRPDVARLYEEHEARSGHALDTIGTEISPQSEKNLIQLTLQFEGFDSFDVRPITIKLDPGREGLINLRVKAG
jgi:hypothetical protein